MKTAVSTVKIKACKNATSTSMKYMNTVKAIETGEAAYPKAGFIWAKMKIRDIKQMMMMCPATMFANNLMISAKGLMKTLRNSTRTRIGLTNPGTPGGLKM
jgi:hypothetical protein